MNVFQLPIQSQYLMRCYGANCIYKVKDSLVSFLIISSLLKSYEQLEYHVLIFVQCITREKKIEKETEINTHRGERKKEGRGREYGTTFLTEHLI